MKTNIHLVAKSANVSKSTVSRVINNHPTVSEDTRKHVLEVIKQLNYEPNKLARGLSSNGFDAISIVYTRPSRDALDNPYFSNIIHAIGIVAENYNFDLILQSASNEEKDIVKTSSMINDRLIKGIILLSSRINDKLIESLAATDIPVIVIGKIPNTITSNNIVSVDTDNYNDCKDIGDYLVKMGHTRIGCIHAPKDHMVSIDRIEGFKQSLRNHNLEIDEELFVDGGHTLDSAYNASLNLLCTKSVTAIFATDDLKALGIYKAAKNLNLQIPKDISVIGHNDFDFSTLLTPPLTTVRVPIYELGYISASKLFNTIKNKTSNESNQIIPTELIVRSSVANLNLER